MANGKEQHCGKIHIGQIQALQNIFGDHINGHNHFLAYSYTKLYSERLKPPLATGQPRSIMPKGQLS